MIILVGEVNPYGGDPDFALYNRPDGCSGHRLQRFLGLSDETYLDLTRVNLCEGKWSLPKARAAANGLLALRHPDEVVVMLGAKVRDAFGCAGTPFYTSFDVGSCWLATLPHPSGLNRMWDEPGAVERARSLLRDVCPDVPWGEVG